MRCCEMFEKTEGMGHMRGKSVMEILSQEVVVAEVLAKL